MAKTPPHPKQILVIQTAFIGDAILATAVLEKLHAKFPSAQIDFLVRKGNESLFKGHPFLREVVVRDKKLGKIKSLFQTIKKVRAKRYDWVVNLHRFFSSGIIAGFSAGKHICGFSQNPMAWRYAHKVPHEIWIGADSPHEIERNQKVIAHLTDRTFKKPKLYPSDADFEAVKVEGDYVCIAPTSVWFTKQWPAEKWVQLIQTIDHSIKVCLIGAPADKAACEAIARESGHPNTVVFAGKHSLLQSAALISGAKMNYVNDSGPMHLASAMNAPVTAIYCSTITDFGFGPRSDQSFVWQTKLDLGCRPCGLHGFKLCPRGHFKCSEVEIPATNP